MDRDEISTDKNLIYREFLHREEMFVRAPYNPEVEFYSCITSGDVKKVDELTDESILDKREGWGILSENELQNVKYHFVITTAVVARYCINAGLPLQTAYDLSDHYILIADKCKTPRAVAALHKPMCLDYAKRMRSLQKKSVQSPYISKCIDLIYDRLHTKISLGDLAEYCGLSESYLSRLFKEKTGLTVSDYITKQKINTAKKMLRFSDYSVSDIANTLAFPSQSYFTKVFKAECGKTPLAFRNENS